MPNDWVVVNNQANIQNDMVNVDIQEEVVDIDAGDQHRNPAVGGNNNQPGHVGEQGHVGLNEIRQERREAGGPDEVIANPAGDGLAGAQADNAEKKLRLTQACRALKQQLSLPEEQQDKAQIAQALSVVKGLANDKGRDDLKVLLQKAGEIVQADAQYQLSEADAQAFFEADAGIGDCSRRVADIQAHIADLKAHVNDPVRFGENVPEELQNSLEPIVVMARLEQIEAEERTLKCVQTREQLDQEVANIQSGNLPQGNEVQPEGEPVQAEAPEQPAEGQAPEANPEQQAKKVKQEAINQLISKLVKANVYAEKLRILSDPNATPVDVAAARQVLDSDEAVALDQVSYKVISNKLATMIAMDWLAQLDPDDPLQPLVLKASQVAVKSGVDPQAFLNAIFRGAASVGGSEAVKADAVKLVLELDHNDDYDRQMMDVASGKLPAENAKSYNELLGETLRYVDMLFQKGYPNLSKDALLVKMALCPGHEEDVKLQHNAMLAHRCLLSKIEAKDVAMGKELTVEQRKHLQTLSAKSFFLTPQLVKNLQGAAKEVKFPLEELNYQIAHLALLQYKMLERGLLPVPKMMVAPAQVQAQGAQQGQPAQDAQQAQPAQDAQQGQAVPQAQQGQPVQAAEGYQDPEGDDFDVDTTNLQGKSAISSEAWEARQKVIDARLERAAQQTTEIVFDQPNDDSYQAYLAQKRAAGELPQVPDLPDHALNPQQKYSLNRSTNVEVLSARDELMNLNDWCSKLHLPEAVVQLVSDTSLIIDSQDQGLAKLNSATESYLIGLTGTEAENKLTSKLQKKNALGKDADKLAENTPEVMANVALNLRIADITGYYKASDRLVDPESGLAIDGAKIQRRMRKATEFFFTKFEKNRQVKAFHREELAYQRVVQENQVRRGRLAEQANGAQALPEMDVITNLKYVTDHLNKKDPEVRKLRADRQKLRARRSEYSFGWLNSRRSKQNARVQVADILTTYLSAKQRFEAMHPDDPNLDPAAFNAAKTEMENARRALAGVDPVKMVMVEGRTDIPSERVIDDVMTPRLAVIDYFDRRDANGRSKADLDKADLAKDKKLIKQMREDQKVLAADIRKAMDEYETKWFDDLVLSAALKVLIESRQPMNSSLLTSDMMKKIQGQLEEWGMPKSALYEGLVNRQLRKITHSSGMHSDGRIKTSVLRSAAEDKSMHFSAGRRGLELYKESEEFRNLGNDGKVQKQNLKDTLLPKSVVNKETASSLMALASQPGQSFTYSRTSGLNFDSGNILELRKNNSATAGWFFTKLSFTAFPLSVRVKAMKENSFAIKNTGKGYEVTVKGGWIRGLAVGSQVFGIDAAKTTFSLSVDATLRKASGAVLNFANEEDCRKFVQALMAKQLPEVGELRKLFLKANQIRTVEESGKTVDLTASALNLYLAHDFDPVKINNFDITGTPRLAVTAGVTFGKGWKTTQEVTTNKTTTTRHTDGKFNFQTGVRFEVNAKHQFDAMANYASDVKEDLAKAKEKPANNVEEEILNRAEIAARKWYSDNIAKDKLMAKSAGQSFLSFALNGNWSCDQKLVTDENGLSEDCTLTLSRTWTGKFGTTKIMPGKHKGFLGLFFPGHAWRLFLSDAEMKKLKNKNPEAEAIIEGIAQSVGPNDKVNVIYKISKKSLEEARLLLAQHNAILGNSSADNQERKDLMDKFNQIMSDKKNYVPSKISVTCPKGSRAFAQWSPTFAGFEFHGNNSLTMSQTKGGYEFNLGDVE